MEEQTPISANASNDSNHSNHSNVVTEPRPSRRALWLAMSSVALAIALVWFAPGIEDHPEDGEPVKASLDYTLKDVNGIDVPLDSFEGKVVLVNFWATWCPPCKAEIPGFVALQDQYRDQGLVILGISGDDDAETLKKFASEWKINYPMLVGRDETALLDAYGPIYGYPISVIVGRDGAVCGRHVGPATKEEFEQEIKALL
jgi:thiol-disulfide isomerase/thioredoxin